MKATVRKYQTTVDETLREIGREISPPTRRATAMAVIANPFAGEYQEDLSLLMDIGAELDLDIPTAIIAKHKYNKGRPYKHGREF